MTAPIATDLDPATIAAIEHALRVPCEAFDYTTNGGRKPCREPAEWAARARCHCGKADYTVCCDRHREILLKGGLIAIRCELCHCKIPTEQLIWTRL